MKKKILIACRAYYPDIGGGGELSTKTLAENLLRKGYDVEVVTVSDTEVKEKIDGIPVTRLKSRNIYWSLDKSDKSKLKKLAWHVLDSNNILFGQYLSRELDRIAPDILITSTIEDVSSLIWKLAAKRNIRVMHVLRSYTLLCSNANMFKSDNCVGQCAECKLLTYPKKVNSKYVNDVIGISDFVLNKHLQYGYFPNARKNVIYNICLGDDEIDKKMRADDEIRIGYLGRIHKTKGIEMIFSSLAKLPDETKSKCVVYVAGDGDEIYIQKLKDIAIDNKINSVFVGNVKADVFLGTIDLLIVPSVWNEPFGRVVVEGMGQNVAVLGKKSGGIPELLRKNKEFIFDTENELTSKIEEFVNSSIKFNFDLSDFKTDKIVSDWEHLIALDVTSGV